MSSFDIFNSSNLSAYVAYMAGADMWMNYNEP